MKKLKLEELKVKSVVTSLEKNESETIDGGSTIVCFTASVVSFSIIATASIIISANVEINSIDNGKCTNIRFGCADRYRTELCI